MEQSSILSFFKKPGSAQSSSSRPQHSHSNQPYRRNNTNARKHRPYNQHRAPDRRRNMDLELVANETKNVLPGLVEELPAKFNVEWSCLESLDHPDTAPLPPQFCPAFTTPCTIQVLNMDSFDAAIQLDPSHTVSQHGRKKELSANKENRKLVDDATVNTDSTMEDVATPENAEGEQNVSENKTQKPEHKKQTEGVINSEKVSPVAVLNLASERSPGGGWQKGALAQEECLCYRSSLSLSLHRRWYPIPPLSAIYSPNVVIIRESMSNGHKLLANSPPDDLPAVSVISVAALRQPGLSDDGKKFEKPGARCHTKKNIRLILRVAARHGHTKLVLGALGCGVFANPPQDVAECFLEVFQEQEFQGGWWEKVVFAVLDNVSGPNGGKDGKGNFGQFYQVLDGQVLQGASGSVNSVMGS